MKPQLIPRNHTRSALMLRRRKILETCSRVFEGHSMKWKVIHWTSPSSFVFYSSRFFSSSLVKLLNHLLFSALSCSWCNNSQKKRRNNNSRTSKIVAVYLLQLFSDSSLEFDSANSYKLTEQKKESVWVLDQVIKVCWTTMTAARH